MDVYLHNRGRCHIIGYSFENYYFGCILTKIFNKVFRNIKYDKKYVFYKLQCLHKFKKLKISVSSRDCTA